jgi:predicted Fe-S protein YdhL (DUF1289 family)
MCIHIYQNVDSDICPYCGRDTHEVDYNKQRELKEKWKLENPDAKYGGWWSI